MITKRDFICANYTLTILTILTMLLSAYYTITMLLSAYYTVYTNYTNYAA